MAHEGITPETREEFSAQIPALQLLSNLGWQYMSAVDCLEARGGNQEVVLVGVLVEELRKRRFEYKGKSYPLSGNAIDQIVRELTAVSLHEGLATANEQLYNKITPAADKRYNELQSAVSDEELDVMVTALQKMIRRAEELN